MARRLGVTGRPILHSQSPALFRAAWAHEESLEGGRSTYVRLRAASAGEALDLAREIGLDGLNVTSPFKETMAQQMDELDATSAAIGAVNTVRLDGRLRGYNTDPQGAVGALRDGGADLTDQSVVVIGTGGAGRAAAWGAARAGARQVVLVSRDEQRARRVAQELELHRSGSTEDDRADPTGAVLTGVGPAAAREAVQHAGVVIACATRGVQPFDTAWLHAGQVVLDANYGPSPLSRPADAAGCQVVPGERWLLHQAAESFGRLTDGLAPLAAMRGALDPLPSSRPGPNRNVVLAGFMGVGKSTVGQQLAARLKWSFIDTDRACEERAGRSVAQMFPEPGGEARFRRLEREIIERVGTDRSTVFACGGGALLDEASRAVVCRHALVIWLWAPLDVCLARLAASPRPLLSGADRTHAAEALLQERLPSYAETSALVLGVAQRTSAEAADEIAHELHLLSARGGPTDDR